jgi:hypothetical protein
MDEIERVVLTGLQKHLKAPHLLREFAEAYHEERQRLASKRIYPSMRIAASGGSMVAEVRYRRSPRLDWPLFTLLLEAA